MRQSRELFISIPVTAGKTPNVSIMGPFFNNLNAHVQSEILGKKDLGQRKLEMERWITILDELSLIILRLQSSMKSARK